MKRPQAHHDLPQGLRDKFEKRGLDIDDPRYGRWVEGGPYGDHQKWSRKLNDEWEEFLDSGPTNEQILEKLEQIRKKYQ